MEWFEFHKGDSPLLVSIPHAGVWLPTDISDRLTESAKKLPDTDWWVDRLYDISELQHASRLVARVSRYVVDLNRPPDDASLYPGQNTTGVCPTTTFDGEPIYCEGCAPAATEIASRLDVYWRPYHDALKKELARLRTRFDRVILLDAHSIASRVPRLFTGRLPDWNFGTNLGRSCSARLQQRINQFAGELEGYSQVVNGRFVGGYITRHYGQPDQGIEAVQLELSQATYMNEVSRTWDGPAAARLQATLRPWIEVLLAHAEAP